MPRKNFYRKSELLKKLNLTSESDVEMLIRLGFLTPISKNDHVFFSGKEVRRVEKVMAGGHLSYTRIILDIIRRIESLERSMAVVSNILRPSMSDVLYGIGDDELVEMTTSALADVGGEISLGAALERLKIAANLGPEHLDILRQRMKDPAPAATWTTIVRDLRQSVMSRRTAQMAKQDPVLFKQTKAVLKSAEENIARLAVLDRGPTMLTRPPHPRRRVAQLILSFSESR